MGIWVDYVVWEVVGSFGVLLRSYLVFFIVIEYIVDFFFGIGLVEVKAVVLVNFEVGLVMFVVFCS